MNIPKPNLKQSKVSEERFHSAMEPKPQEIFSELEEYKIINRFLYDCGEIQFEYNLLTDFLPGDLQEVVMTYTPITRGSAYSCNDDIITVIFCANTYGPWKPSGPGNTSATVASYREGDDRIRVMECPNVEKYRNWAVCDVEINGGVQCICSLDKCEPALNINYFVIDESPSDFRNSSIRKVIKSKKILNDVPPGGKYYLSLYKTLSGYSKTQLKGICKDNKIKGYTTYDKKDWLVWLILLSGKHGKKI